MKTIFFCLGFVSVNMFSFNLKGVRAYRIKVNSSTKVDVACADTLRNFPEVTPKFVVTF